MKKTLIGLFLLFFVGFQSVSASTNTLERTNENNYGVNKKWKIDTSNLDNIKKTPYVDASEKVYDFADILTDEEEKEIYELINDFIEETNIDMVFVTNNFSYFNDSQNEEFAADFYDYNDFGIDIEDYDGIVLFRNAYPLDKYYDMYTFGKAQLYFNQSRYDDILDSIYYDFSSGNYLEGFKIFKNKTLNYVNDGVAHKYRNAYIDEFGFIKYNYTPPYIIATIISLLVSIITTSILVAKNKMVKKATKASDYLDKKSVNITNREDTFVRTHTSSYRMSSGSGGSGSGSGGGSHRGSSGGGHSSGGGRHG